MKMLNEAPVITRQPIHHQLKIHNRRAILELTSEAFVAKAGIQMLTQIGIQPSNDLLVIRMKSWTAMGGLVMQR